MTNLRTRAARRDLPPLGAFLSLVCLFLALLLLGCVVPGVVPLQTHTKGVYGEDLNGTVNLGFIRVGETNRAEVLEKLGRLNTGVRSDDFFLARWASSNWGSFTAVGVPYVYADATGARHWTVHNALVEFDDQGIVKRYATFGDSSLIDELSPLAEKEKAVDFTTPREISVEHVVRRAHRTDDIHPATIILGAGSFEVQELGEKPHNFKIAATKVMQVRRVTSDLSNSITLVVPFTERTEVGESMTIRGYPGAPTNFSDLMLLLEFLSQNR